jgi:hypothetical protein
MQEIKFEMILLLKHTKLNNILFRDIYIIGYVVEKIKRWWTQLWISTTNEGRGM